MSGYFGAVVNVAVKLLAVILLCVDGVWASDFFHMGPVEYFPGSKRSMREGFRKAQKIADWREPVDHFLDDPTPDNARQYLAWQDEKIQRVLKAQEVLAAVEQEEQKH
jgi:hypothetical protein